MHNFYRHLLLSLQSGLGSLVCFISFLQRFMFSRLPSIPKSAKSRVFIKISTLSDKHSYIMKTFTCVFTFTFTFNYFITHRYYSKFFPKSISKILKKIVNQHNACPWYFPTASLKYFKISALGMAKPPL